MHLNRKADTQQKQHEKTSVIKLTTGKQKCDEYKIRNRIK
jgi:hypothetical protein